MSFCLLLPKTRHALHGPKVRPFHARLHKAIVMPRKAPLLMTLIPDAKIGLLGVSQIICYGTLYYAFALLAPLVAEALNVDLAWIFGAFSLGLLVGGLAAPLAGRLIDRVGGRWSLAAGSVVCALALLGLSQSDGWLWFALGLIAVEVASTLTLYDATFAAVSQVRHPLQTRKAITQITLFGGFASTVFWPLTHQLLQHLTWSEVYVAFAALHLVICLPIHLWALRPHDTDASTGDTDQTAPLESLPLRREVQRPAMFLLVTSFCLTGFIYAALNVHWVESFATLGAATGAAVAAGALMGPSQVAVRVIDLLVGQRMHPVSSAMMACGFMVFAIAPLLVFAPNAFLLSMFAVFFGLSQGLTSIVRGTVPLALFGRNGYAARLGDLASLRLVITSAAPVVFATSVAMLGIGFTLYGALIATLGAVLALWRIERLRRGRAKPA